MREYDYRVVITGQLSTNKYRYPNEKREIICTTTLLRGHGLHVLVDPGWRDEPLLASLREAQVKPEQIDIVYLTHLHADHIRSSRLFPGARWLASPREIANWRDKIPEADRDILERLEPVEEEIAEGLQIVQTPGHTLAHTSVLFRNNGKRVLVAADAVLVKEYYEHREVHVISEDAELAKQTIDRIKTMADIVIPGHDEPFAAF